ncbi:hypothetical protein P5673_007534 [Acropora cervicornis]|uniref:Uncharacterized protein n=1 Tax=Acropora cervicornis TaxID=6130 RepID=A0AAD9QW61_ACRCE|nr:hypothetical protein P5673_007534 [Acropora cervicornis]
MWRVYNLHHTSVFTYSHAKTPLGQSEHAYYLSCFINLDGDGRCDVPGHSAKYGTYTLMDEDTGNVVVSNVNQVSEVSSSNVVEKEGFSPSAKDLEEKGVKISRIGADRHVSISSSMAKDFPHTSHQ